MGLLDKLTTGSGSPFSKANGGSIPTPVGATNQSRLHGFSQSPGYSINGNPHIPFKPTPSLLDINGVQPIGPLNASGVVPINDTFKLGTYKASLPISAQGRVN